MFLVNASQSNDFSVHNDAVLKVQSDCHEIMQLCNLDILTTQFSNERQIIESEEFVHFDTYAGVINLKYLERDVQTDNPFQPIYSTVNNDAATTSMIDIFCELLNRDSYGSSGYVSARNVWFEQYNMPRAICINLATCPTEAEFQREVPAYGQRIATCLIAYLRFLLPAAIPLIDSKCRDFFGEKSDYVSGKLPYEL